MTHRFLIVAALGLVACSSSSSSRTGDAGVMTAVGGATASGGATGTGGTTSTGGTTGTGGSVGTQLTTGDPCTDDAQCPGISGQIGTCMKTWPGGGACTVVGCSADCPGKDSWCTLDKTGEKTYCAPFCQPGIIACTRPGYVCAPSGGCLPPDVGGTVGGDR